MSLFTFMILLGFVPWVESVVTVHAGRPPRQGAPNLGRVFKTIVSNKLRLIFTLGLEGSGHHYMFAAEDAMHRKNTTLPGLANFELDAGLYNIGRVMNESPGLFETQEMAARAEMRRLAQRTENVPWPGIVVLQRGCLSYPNGNGQLKVFNYMDMRLMAEVAEAEGVDFRVLYLRRSAKDLIVANTVHRNFQDWLGAGPTATPEQRLIEYIKVLFTALGVLHSFLAEIDPAFVVCHDWNYLGNADQAKTISNFVAPTPEVALLFEESLVGIASVRHNRTEELPLGAGAVAARLQKKLDSLESLYCGHLQRS